MVSGLTLIGLGSGVVGLDIENFGGSGIVLRADSSLINSKQFVAGCFIGTDPTGTLPRGNGGNGISAMSAYSTIGGGGRSGNVLSANRGSGVVISASSVQIAGNRIGTDSAGAKAMGNGREGVDANAGGFLIGGPNADQGNVISANASSGIFVLDSAAGMVQGANRIGTNAAGTAALGNGFSPAAPGHDGITINTAGAVKIVDSTSAGAVGVDNRNLISGNKADGVTVYRAVLTLQGISEPMSPATPRSATALTAAWESIWEMTG